MSDATAAGIRDPYFVRVVDVPDTGDAANHYFHFGISDFKEQPIHVKQSVTLGNARRVILRPYLPGKPAFIQKFAHTFSLPRAAEQNYWLVQRILSANFVDAASMKMLMERFAVPVAGAFSPVLFRRPFLNFVDSSLWSAANWATKFATIDYPVVSGVVTPGSPTAGSADAYGHTAITPSATPDAGSVYEVRYLPLYMMEVQDSTGDDRTFPEPFREMRVSQFLEC